jgi:hypothetical protein
MDVWRRGWNRVTIGVNIVAGTSFEMSVYKFQNALGEPVQTSEMFLTKVNLKESRIQPNKDFFYR